MGYRNKKHKLQRSTPPRRNSLEPEAAVGPEESAPKLRLLDRVRQAIRTRHYSPRTEKAYVHWIKRFIFFHNKRHPDTMGEREISAFLTDLANRAKVSASTQNQALCAVLFLYRHVLRRELDEMEFVRAKRPKKLPLVLSRREVDAVFQYMEGTKGLMANLIYGSGVRLLECCRTRVKDVDLERRELTVRDGRGEKDRVTVLPETLLKPLANQLRRVRAQHQRDLRQGAGFVELPYALATRQEIPKRGPRMGMAMGLSSDETLHPS